MPPVVASDDGELADNTIVTPNDNNKITVINNVKSKDLYVLFSLFIFGILVSFLSKLLYIEYNPTIQSIRVITLKTDTILFSFHPDNSKW